MIPKLIYPDAFDFGMPTVALLNQYSRGFDDRPLRKRAALFNNDIQSIEKKPNHAYLHLITTGAVERYGNNSNGDAFNKEARDLVIPDPQYGKPSVIRLDGGLKKYHNNTYEKYASVYRNHVNKHKNGVPSGYIVKAAYNEDMDRGELIVGVDKDVWADDLEKVASEKPIYFSMAADVPYDTCSYCGNQATKLSDYCQHAKYELGTITKEGHQVCVYNDNPQFHDISGVFKPADKIAFALRKVASSEVVSSAELARAYGLTPRVMTLNKFAGIKGANMYNLLNKLATIEKEILAQPSECPSLDAFSEESGCCELPDELISKLRGHNPNEVFGSLKKHMVMLPFESFLKLVMGQNFSEIASLVPDAKDSLDGVFESLLEKDGLEEYLNDSSYEPIPNMDRNIDEEVGKLVGSHSLAAEPVKRRIIKITINATPTAKVMPKKAAIHKNAAAEFLAGEYARYALSFASGCDESVLHLTTAQMVANSNR
jgi:hypothetical protein